MTTTAMLPPADDGGETLTDFADRLAQYADANPLSEPYRHVPQGQRPWPARHNVMLEYLIHRSVELLETEGPQSAIVWLAAHAWFEGGLAEREATLREVTS